MVGLGGEETRGTAVIDAYCYVVSTRTASAVSRTHYDVELYETNREVLEIEKLSETNGSEGWREGGDV